ncbi:MAG TPA: asparagine synthase-related protein, partial [Acidimicrobiia bacterium]|nr:asparagine synthase-related protein [Acidimicrobiia bacterium]
MPGLVALVDPRGQVPEDLDAMAEALPRRPWHKEERVSVPGFAAAVVGDGTESVARHGDLVLVLFGHVHGDVHDRGDLRSPAARLVDVADRRSPQALTEFDGAYVALVWDRRLRALHAVTDAGGWRRLHWRQAPDGRVALATRGDAVARVSGISSAVDVEGAADLLTLGFLQGERTLLDGVRLAEPGASLTVEDGRVRAASNRGRPVLPTLEGSDGELIEALGGHVERAVARALAGVPQDEELVIQLTGGLDSRVLAGMIRRLDPDRPTTAVTIGHAHAHDVTSARAVARALGLPHHVEPVGADYLSRLGPAGVDRVEGQVTLDAAWVLAVDTPLDERLGPPVVNGFLADALTGANLPRSVRDLTGLPEEQAAQGYFDRYLNRVFRPPELTRLLAPGVADAAARPAEVTVSAYLGAAGDH